MLCKYAFKWGLAEDVSPLINIARMDNPKSLILPRYDHQGKTLLGPADWRVGFLCGHSNFGEQNCIGWRMGKPQPDDFSFLRSAVLSFINAHIAAVH